MRSVRLGLSILICVIASGVYADSSRPFSSALWKQAPPAEAGLDGKSLSAFDADLSGGRFPYVDSFLLVRCGLMAFESTYEHDYTAIYRKTAALNGPLSAQSGPYDYLDPVWYPYYRKTRMHTMQSVTKTVTSLVLGIAMDRGDFKAALDTPVMSWFRGQNIKYSEGRKQHMTLENVLTMTSGLDWNEDSVADDDPSSDSTRMEASGNWIEYVINHPMAAEPGTVFNYNSGGSELLAHIFHEETGLDVIDYAAKNLLGPLGIHFIWKRAPNGLADTEGGLYLEPRDLAKIGYLVMKQGAWNGKQIVSKKWIAESLTPRVKGDDGLQYGFQWWLYPRPDGTFIPMSQGWGGQKLVIYPREEMIAVYTGWGILGTELSPQVAAERPLSAVQTSSCPDHVHH